MRSLLLLLLAAELLLASTVVVTYVVKPDGKTVMNVKLRDVLINNSPQPLNVSGVVLSPYSAAVVEREAGGVYPPFLAVDVNLHYINGTLTEGVLRADKDTVIELRLGIRVLLPISALVVVSIPVDDKIAVLYETPPTSITQISGTTVYYWTLFVTNYTDFRVKFRVKQFGSFGAVRMPSVTVTTALSFNDTLLALVKRAEELNVAYTQLRNFTEVVSLFTDTVYGQLQNLTQLIQILNLTGTALRQGAAALNTSTYALEALRMQILVLGDTANGVAEALNQSLLLVNYQYTALITAANLLEVQSSALYSYKAAAAEALKSLRDTQTRLYTIRGNLLNARQTLNEAIRNVEDAKRRLLALNASGLPQARQAVETAVAVLDSAAAQLYALRGVVDSLISTVDASIAIIDSAANTLETTSRSLGELAPLLNNTAVSTRRNATELREAMPQIVLNATKKLQEVAHNLYKTGADVVKFAAPLHNASATLANVGAQLQKYAEELSEFRVEQLRALPRLGFVESAVQNYSYIIDMQRREIETQIEALRRYYVAINTTEIELRWQIELPIAVRNITLSLSPTRYETTSQGSYVQLPTLLAVLTGAAGVTSALFFILKKK
jgi:nucleotide-binding universal stress UspA family protein